MPCKSIDDNLKITGGMNTLEISYSFHNFHREENMTMKKKLKEYDAR